MLDFSLYPGIKFSHTKCFRVNGTEMSTVVIPKIMSLEWKINFAIIMYNNTWMIYAALIVSTSRSEKFLDWGITHINETVINSSLMLYQIFVYLAGFTRLSSSVARCLRIIFLDCGMPSAVAMVSAVKEGSSTTRAPCTPLSVWWGKNST